MPYCQNCGFEVPESQPKNLKEKLKTTESMNAIKPKFGVGIKQTAKGVYYLGHLRVDGDTVDEMEKLMDSALSMIVNKINSLNKKSVAITENKNDVKPVVNQDEPLNVEDAKLFEELRQLRMRISNEEGFAPYFVFYDSALKSIAKQRPKTLEDMLKLHGIGQKKVDKFGKAFLNVVKEFEENSNGNRSK